VSNPYTTILGRAAIAAPPGYDIDIEKVAAACAEHGVAVEINAKPWRLDLDWLWHEPALRLGCLMSVNPDSHSTGPISTLLSLALRRIAAGLRGARSLVQIALALAGGCLLALVPVAGSGLTGLALHVTLGLVPVCRLVLHVCSA
jgi:hypothetical protein